MLHKRSSVAILHQESKNVRKRENNTPVRPRNPPLLCYHRKRQNNHRCDHDKSKNEDRPVPLPDLGHLEEEIRPLDFLLSRAPRNIIREEMR